MSEIPDDVMKAARGACQSIYELLPDHPEENIALAIMAERERCAVVAERVDGTYEAGEIALAIRKGEA